FEIEDRVPDDLTGTVVRNVAATVSFVYFVSFCSQQLTREEQVALFRPASQRDHARVLEQEESVRHAAGGALLHQHLLRREAVLVLDPAQPPDVKRAQHQPAMFLASGRGTDGA